MLRPFLGALRAPARRCAAGSVLGLRAVPRNTLSASARASRSANNVGALQLRAFARQYSSNPGGSSNSGHGGEHSHHHQNEAGPFKRLFRRLFEGAAVLVAVPVGYVAAFFIYDFTTYKGGPLVMDVTVPIDSLKLRRGGPKNLLVADSYIDDIELGHTADKPRVVVLGSGWGAVSFVNSVDTSKYNVTVISPTNHFLFTPLLPSAATGTLSLDTLVDPIRRICRQKNVRFVQAAAHDVVFDERLIEVKSDDPLLRGSSFYCPYDKLVIATGATTNTHGVPGMENCMFFKTANDSTKLRSQICHTLELASLPSTTEEERRRLLSFVICGGGPTGVELAAEIYDLLKEDVPKMFPNLLINLASVHIIQSRSAILNTYDETISKYAMDRFMRDGIDLQTNARVNEVTSDSVIFTKTLEDGSKKVMSIPAGIKLWTTGVGLTPLVKRVMKALPDYQHNRRALETDSQLRVLGTPKGEVYAIGDCSTVKTALADELGALISDQLHHNIDPNDEYDLQTIDDCLKMVQHNEPQALVHLKKLREKIHKWHGPHDKVHLSTVLEDLKKVDTKVTSLPATAQRANQQGGYLGKKFNRLALATPEMVASYPDLDNELNRPFAYHHLGSLAYISNDAVFDTNNQIGFNLFGGIFAMYLWRSVYMSQTVTNRARVHMFFDWLYRGLFGRQIYSYESVENTKDS